VQEKGRAAMSSTASSLWVGALTGVRPDHSSADDTPENMPDGRRADCSRLHATLFGAFKLTGPDGEEIVVTGKRARALLAILCLEPGVAIERDRVCELLWRGGFRAQARASLRQTLLGLKKQLSPIVPDFFDVTRDRVAVNAATVRSDLAEVD
jgi:two-component SAPR family response regulator